MKNSRGTQIEIIWQIKPEPPSGRNLRLLVTLENMTEQSCIIMTDRNPTTDEFVSFFSL